MNKKNYVIGIPSNVQAMEVLFYYYGTQSNAEKYLKLVSKAHHLVLSEIKLYELVEVGKTAKKRQKYKENNVDGWVG